MTPVLSVEGLTFGYAGQTLIFRDFAFQTHSRVTLIRGPSGCGKTTLLKVMAGTLRPPGVRVLRPRDPYLVLQADLLPGWLSPRQLLRLFAPPLLKSIESSDLFVLVGEFWDRRAADLSFGQRRTFELVCALAAKPGLLLLDEPFNFLDRSRRERFYEAVASATATQIVLTSHYDEDAAIEGVSVFEFGHTAPHVGLLGWPA